MYWVVEVPECYVKDSALVVVIPENEWWAKSSDVSGVEELLKKHDSKMVALKFL